jgi:DNA-directed RNA polymerase specialized sigma24 family protein
MLSVASELRSGDVDPAAWNALLAFLDRGRGDRGGAYVEVRRRLQFFFEWKGCAAAPELADEVLNRVAAKLAAGEEIHTSEPLRYVLGVARLVSLEAYRRMGKQRAEDEGAHVAADDRDERLDGERRLAALEACLDGLPARARELLVRYHAHSAGRDADHRRELAEEWRLSANALRIRVHRLRDQMEGCVRARLETAEGAPSRPGSRR